MFLLQQLQAQLTLLPKTQQLWVGLSGGIDSVVLLHALTQLNLTTNVKALHINHGLQQNASQWAQYCTHLCQSWHIECIVIALNLSVKPGESIEAVARTARYQAMQQHVQTGDIVLTAHHQDDQAETVLLQLLRGSGVRGIAAMPFCQAFAQGWLARPLLNISRHSLHDYATHHHLQWIEDDSNADLKFNRNYLRHQVIPILSQRWPQLGTLLSRTAQHAAEADTLLADLAKQDLTIIRNQQGLSVTQLRLLTTQRCRNVLRYWIRSSGFSLPDQTHLLRIQNEVLSAKPDKMPYVHWQQTEIRRYQDTLYIMPPLTDYDSQLCLQWSLQQPLTIPGIGTLMATLTTEPGLDCRYQQLTIRLRQGGERCKLHGHWHRLRKLWQQWGVPPWLRQRHPILYIDQQIAVIPGHAVCDSYRTQPKQRAWNIQWLKDQPLCKQ